MCTRKMSTRSWTRLDRWQRRSDVFRYRLWAYAVLSQAQSASFPAHHVRGFFHLQASNDGFVWEYLAHLGGQYTEPTASTSKGGIIRAVCCCYVSTSRRKYLSIDPPSLYQSPIVTLTTVTEEKKPVTGEKVTGEKAAGTSGRRRSHEALVHIRKPNFIGENASRKASICPKTPSSPSHYLSRYHPLIPFHPGVTVSLENLPISVFVRFLRLLQSRLRHSLLSRISFLMASVSPLCDPHITFLSLPFPYHVSLHVGMCQRLTPRWLSH